MSGYFVVHRGVFDHIVFDDEPFSQREAWLWLIREAAWEAKRVMVKCGNAREFIDLERGQLTHSERFLAEAWQWSRQKVRGFLSRLEAAEMLTQNRDHLQCIITICNYDKYQLGQQEKKPTLDQHETNTGPKKKNLKTDDDHEERREPPQQNRPLISPWAFDLAREIGVICGHDPAFIPPGWHGAPYRIEAWRAKGWDREICLASVRDQIAKKRDGPPATINYFEKGIAAAHARQGEPLPEATIIPQRTVEAKRAEKTNTPNAGIRALREKLSGAGPSGLRDAPDGADVRLLPERRSE